MQKNLESLYLLKGCNRRDFKWFDYLFTYNEKKTPAMTVGGTGDVLSGLSCWIVIQ